MERMRIWLEHRELVFQRVRWSDNERSIAKCTVPRWVFVGAMVSIASGISLWKTLEVLSMVGR
jgi:hypothetical protein